MGYWSIDESNPECDDVWGDTPTDAVDDYLEYLKITDPLRLQKREVLLKDLKVLVWQEFYDSGSEHGPNRKELEYGLDWCFRECQIAADGTFSKDGVNDDARVPVNNEHIKSDFDEGDFEDLIEYFEYLKETEPERLKDKDQLIEDVRILTWENFEDLRGRPAREEELRYILKKSNKNSKYSWGALGELFSA